MTRVKAALMGLILFAATCSAQTADTVGTADTVIDTVYHVDTVTVNPQAQDMAGKFYELAERAVEHKMTTITVILTIIAILLAGFTIFLFVQARHTRREIEKELQASRQAIQQELQRARDEVDKIVAVRKDAATHAREVQDLASRAIAVADELAKTKPGISLEDKIKLINDTDAEKSVDEYEKLLFAMELEGIPKDKIPTSLHKNVAMNYYKLERWEKALEGFELYLKKAPKDANVLFYAGYCYSVLDKPEPAIDMFRQSLSLNDQNSSAYVNWGWALTKLYSVRKDTSLLDDAIQKYEKALEINERDDNAYANWGSVLTVLFDQRKDPSLLDEAIEKYKRASELNERNDMLYYNWGESLRRLYDVRKDPALLEEAILNYKKATEINDRLYAAHRNRIVALLKLYHVRKDNLLLQEALAMSKKVLEMDPEVGAHHYNLACTYALLGNKAEMLSALKQAVEYDRKGRKIAREDKDFEKYWDDPDFISLTKEE